MIHMIANTATTACSILLVNKVATKGMIEKKEAQVS